MGTLIGLYMYIELHLCFLKLGIHIPPPPPPPKKKKKKKNQLFLLYHLILSRVKLHFFTHTHPSLI